MERGQLKGAEALAEVPWRRLKELPIRIRVTLTVVCLHRENWLKFLVF